MTVDMSAFKHVVVPLGVIIGLGVVHIATALSSYLEDRKYVRFSLAHSLWIAVTLFWLVGLWWVLWRFRVVDTDRWSFFSLLLLLVGPLSLYFSASLLLPKAQPATELDLGERLDQVARLLFVCMSCTIVWLGVCELVLLQQPLGVPHRYAQLAVLAILAGGAIYPSRKVAAVMGSVFFVMTIIVFTTFRANLS